MGRSPFPCAAAPTIAVHPRRVLLYGRQRPGGHEAAKASVAILAALRRALQSDTQMITVALPRYHE